MKGFSVKNVMIGIVILSVAVIVLVGVLLKTKGKPDHVMRIGWQSAWATQGQLAEVLQHTNICELYGVNAKYESFIAGPPMSEAAVAGNLDVVLLGDQPAISLLSRSDNWKIIGRLMDFRAGIIVPAESDIKSINDLKGKTIGIPFGTSAHRVAYESIFAGSLDPEKDIEIVNIDIQEQNEIVNTAGKSKVWKGVDAFASWDHHIANFVNQGFAKVVLEKKALGVIMMSKKYMKENPQAASKLRYAFRMAYFYYALHSEQANNWFIEETSVKSFDNQDLLNKVAKIEPNMAATKISDVNVSITDVHNRQLQAAADFAYKHKLINMEVNLLASKCTDTTCNKKVPEFEIILIDQVKENKTNE